MRGLILSAKEQNRLQVLNGVMSGVAGQFVRQVVDLQRTSEIGRTVPFHQPSLIDHEINLGGLHNPLSAIANYEGNHVFPIYVRELINIFAITY